LMEFSQPVCFQALSSLRVKSGSSGAVVFIGRLSGCENWLNGWTPHPTAHCGGYKRCFLADR
jgi:hypothetical protein